MSLFWQARFYTTVNHLRDLPQEDVPEVAFAGRSNAGKSSAINALCQQKQLAYASRTPGRTQHINFFSIGGAQVGQHRRDPVQMAQLRAFLVDLPGYGYAEVSGSAKQYWQTLLADYLMTRAQLRALVLVMDARHPFQAMDTQLLEWFAATGKPVHCLLTKADKLSRSVANRTLNRTRSILESYVDKAGTPFPFSAQLFSSAKRLGLDTAAECLLARMALSDKTS
ncbi:MAG: ribosome biogenesis GTP-binding protein YihA/YsxC [Burkholderiaceae bacterium]|jgi:GTP-binding protein|nr:ribosome biogenesis GTP-binding protein YihA/YsxC [Burkholderiaceae bacterium]